MQPDEVAVGPKTSLSVKQNTKLYTKPLYGNSSPVEALNNVSILN